MYLKQLVMVLGAVGAAFTMEVRGREAGATLHAMAYAANEVHAEREVFEPIGQLTRQSTAVNSSALGLWLSARRVSRDGTAAAHLPVATTGS